MSDASGSTHSLGPIRLAPGVTVGQILIFFCVVITALCVTVFMPLMQAFVFTEMLHIPKAEQGRLAGNLLTTQQIAILCCVGLTGSLLDRIGRKRVLLIALIGYVICLVAYPLAGSVATLFGLQFVFGMMLSGHIAGTSAMIVDYPENTSRGKFVAANILLQAAISAIVIGFVGARLPSWFVAYGFDPETAGRYAFWVVAALAVIAACITGFFLKNPPRGSAPPAEPSRTFREGAGAFLANLKRVVAHGRRNPRFGLVMTMGLVIRSDYVVMLSFVSLWVINAAGAQGVSSVDALKTAGLLALTFKLATAGAQAVFGFVVDRFDRSTVLIGALFATGFSLMSTLTIHDVFGTGIFVVVAVIGVAESALIVCGQAMLGEEAPADLRGSAVGVFYFTGTLGVVMMSLVAGQLFDKIGYAAPFVMVGLLNLLFAVIGAAMVFRNRPPAPDTSRGSSHVA